MPKHPSLVVAYNKMEIEHQALCLGGVNAGVGCVAKCGATAEAWEI